MTVPLLLNNQTSVRHLSKRSHVSNELGEVKRLFLPFLAMIAMIFSSVLAMPDAHAEGAENFAHAVDHIYAHGTEHFDTQGSETDHEGQNNSATHHHNCSFSLADNAVLLQSQLWRSDRLKGPLATSSLMSRAPPVLKQPPKA